MKAAKEARKPAYINATIMKANEIRIDSTNVDRLSVDVQAMPRELIRSGPWRIILNGTQERDALPNAHGMIDLTVPDGHEIR